mmetsp:Transcript_17987/g.34108  ORF Transcript_17987/g.34108 Transcript_17987/m.34108 type:complete len:276 (-) Transcript_17987:360-1187(-)
MVESRATCFIPSAESNEQQKNTLKHRHEAKNSANDEDLLQVPSLRVLRRDDVIARDRENTRVVDEGHEHNGKHRKAKVLFTGITERVFGSEEDGDEKEEDQLDGSRNTIDAIVAHTLENLPAHDHRIDDNGETRFSQDNVSSSPCSISGSLHGNANFSLLKSRGIVNTITGHTDDLSTHLQNLNNLVFVLRKDFSETISSKNHILLVVLSFAWICFLRFRSFAHRIDAVDGGAHSQSSSGLDSDCGVITGNHLDLNTHLLCTFDGCLCINPWRVK